MTDKLSASIIAGRIHRAKRRRAVPREVSCVHWAYALIGCGWLCLAAWVLHPEFGVGPAATCFAIAFPSAVSAALERALPENEDKSAVDQ